MNIIKHRRKHMYVIFLDEEFNKENYKKIINKFT